MDNFKFLALVLLANGVDLLTETYVIYMERHTSPIVPSAAAGEATTQGRKES